MNIRRGMFRLWVLLSIAYALFIGGVLILHIRPSFQVFVLGPDGHFFKDKNWPSTLAKLNNTTVELSNNVVMVIPAGMTENPADASQLRSYADGRDAEAWEDRLTFLAKSWHDPEFIEVIGIPPVVLFALGVPIVWVLSGFKRDRA